MANAEQHFIRSVADFGRLVAPNSPETRFLEFKEKPLGGWPLQAGAPDVKKKAQRELCRDVSQFANSAGGCLLFGVKEVVNAAKVKVAGPVTSIAEPRQAPRMDRACYLELLRPANIHIRSSNLLYRGRHPCRGQRLTKQTYRLCVGQRTRCDPSLRSHRSWKEGIEPRRARAAHHEQRQSNTYHTSRTGHAQSTSGAGLTGIPSPT